MVKRLAARQRTVYCGLGYEVAPYGSEAQKSLASVQEAKLLKLRSKILFAAEQVAQLQLED